MGNATITKPKGRKRNAERFKGLDVILPQGARSRHMKAVDLIERADALIPDDALTGTSADLRQAAKHLQEAAANIAEMLVYRKIMGVD
jgi:hypothetical protein